MDVISISLPIAQKSANDFVDSDSDIEMDDDNFLTTAKVSDKTQNSSIVTPGELITDDPTWMKGHGTYFLNEKTYSAVAGTILKVNKLLSVIPFNGRYHPETGDHIIGRILEVGNKRWKVDVGSDRHATLMLGSVNLPGGILRRKSESDELQMRNFLKEGDLLNAEVQSTFQSGGAALHTRSLKYGKLRNGVFVSVPSTLIIRAKNHSHDLPGNVSVILGVNGFIWISKTTDKGKQSSSNTSITNKATEAGFNSSMAGGYTPGQSSISITRLEEESSWDIYSDKNDEITDSIKETIARYRSCVLALAHCNIAINETRLVLAYEISLGYGQVNSLTSDEAKLSMGEDLINAEKMRGQSS